MRRSVALAFVVLLFATTAFSQTIYNPTRIEFASPDHDTMVTKYIVEYWLDGVDPATGTPYATSTLAKTAMTVNAGVYSAPLTALVPLPAPQVGKTYKATVKAVGQTDTDVSVRSALSNPFAVASVPVSPSAVSIR